MRTPSSQRSPWSGTARYFNILTGTTNHAVRHSLTYVLPRAHPPLFACPHTHCRVTISRSYRNRIVAVSQKHPRTPGNTPFQGFGFDSTGARAFPRAPAVRRCTDERKLDRQAISVFTSMCSSHMDRWWTRHRGGLRCVDRQLVDRQLYRGDHLICSWMDLVHDRRSDYDLPGYRPEHARDGCNPAKTFGTKSSAVIETRCTATDCNEQDSRLGTIVDGPFEQRRSRGKMQVP